jgi:hypothetical protein
MNEAVFSNCNAEDYINTDKDVQTEPDTMDIDALVQNFRESINIYSKTMPRYFLI